MGQKRSKSDYDGAWKETLQCHFRQVMEKFFPNVASAVEWEHGIEWANKELSQILGQIAHRNRTADVLARVRLHTGETSAILMHVEIQSNFEEEFAHRLALYNSGLHWVFRQRVVTLGILADLRQGWMPSVDHFRLADFETRTQFPICKLIAKLDSEWLGDDSLPVQVARAQVAALRTASDPEARYVAKWQLVRNLYKLGYTGGQVRELFRLIDWMMYLRNDLSAQFKQELYQLEKEMHMPYVTSVERLARAEGGAAILMKQLAKLFGDVPTEIERGILRLSLEQQGALGESLFEFTSLADVQAWLATSQQKRHGDAT